MYQLETWGGEKLIICNKYINDLFIKYCIYVCFFSSRGGGLSPALLNKLEALALEFET